MAGEESLRVETDGTEEEAVEGLEAALKMEVEEEGEGEGEGEEGGEGTQSALGSLEFLIEYADPIRTTLVDARNRFNKTSRLEMLWTVQHHWPPGARFALNFYRNWAQLLFRHPGEPSFTILIREGVNQGEPP